MSIDEKKRNTMKAMVAATAAVAVPGIAGAALLKKNTLTTAAAVQTDSTIALRGTGLKISLAHRYNIGSTAGSRTVVITNTSDNPVTLSHVYPGIVRTEDGSYDINSLLANGPRVFEPQQPYLLQVERLSAQLTERQVPTNTGIQQTVTVNTANPAINGGPEVFTTRTMYS